MKDVRGKKLKDWKGCRGNEWGRGRGRDLHTDGYSPWIIVVSINIMICA